MNPGIIALWVAIELSLVHFFIQQSVKNRRQAALAHIPGQPKARKNAPNSSKKGFLEQF
ncbi:hypothetical protein KIH13_01780 [Pseudomonas viridiflava]|nr:hypothetical protein KIH13_01780 [Pseudomonas viridiflava]